MQDRRSHAARVHRLAFRRFVHAKMARTKPHHGNRLLSHLGQRLDRRRVCARLGRSRIVARVPVLRCKSLREIHHDIHLTHSFHPQLGLFFYQTMDAIDGKQARATGTSSPLGEVVDHGFDTLNCELHDPDLLHFELTSCAGPLGGLIQAAALGLGHSRYTLLCTLVGCWSMWFSTWEEYHTGTLYLGYINGPTEGLLIAVAILTTSGVKGEPQAASSLVRKTALTSDTVAQDRASGLSESMMCLAKSRSCPPMRSCST